MNSLDGQEMTTIANLLGHVRKKGVSLWCENGGLHYRAPKGTLTRPEMEKLTIHKAEIVALLERSAGTDILKPRIQPRPLPGRVPLAYSQLSHWHLYSLNERRSVRQIASATRLLGRLNIDALRESIAEMARRHEALRTQVVTYDGIPMQTISESGVCDWAVDDISSLPACRQNAEVTRLIEKFILEPVDVAVDPLLGIRLLRLRDDEHVLIVAMEHMISDMFSLNILLRDLFTAYAQVCKGRPFSLPAIPLQFADYAVWQRSAEQSWLEKHGSYWDERLTRPCVLRFPEDEKPAVARIGWGTVPLRISTDLRAELSEWCRTRGTTLVMGVFTAYVTLLLRWCNVPEGIVRYQVDGRVDADIENTIGYFALPLYLRVALLDTDSFLDLTKRITEEYCSAYEHADFCYLEARVPRPEFARSNAFNWLPTVSEIDVRESDNVITRSPVPFVHPMIRTLEWDAEPAIVLSEGADDVVGGLHFPLSRFSTSSMERFARNFLAFIRALLRHSDGRVTDIPLL